MTKALKKTSKGSETREKILDSAEALILDRGYSGVSVDLVIENIGLTKGAFFHHFKNKGDMAVALIERFTEKDLSFFHESMGRARKLSDDPLQQMIILIGLYQEMFGGLSKPWPGCLLASYIYEIQMFGDDVMEAINNTFLIWREELRTHFDRIAETCPPRIKTDFSALADEFTVIIEGAFIMSKSLNEPDLVNAQLEQYKNYIELLFRK